MRIQRIRTNTNTAFKQTLEEKPKSTDKQQQPTASSQPSNQPSNNNTSNENVLAPEEQSSKHTLKSTEKYTNNKNRDGKCERDAQYRRIIFGIRGKYAHIDSVAFGRPIVNDCYLVFANQSFNVTIAHDTSEIRIRFSLALFIHSSTSFPFSISAIYTHRCGTNERNETK